MRFSVVVRPCWPHNLCNEHGQRNKPLHRYILGVRLDPIRDLVHDLLCHVTGNGVGGGSRFLAALDRHEEVTEAGIQHKLHVASAE